jgi:hypothetical protein
MKPVKSFQILLDGADQTAHIQEGVLEFSPTGNSFPIEVKIKDRPEGKNLQPA